MKPKGKQAKFITPENMMPHFVIIRKSLKL